MAHGNIARLSQTYQTRLRGDSLAAAHLPEPEDAGFPNANQGVPALTPAYLAVMTEVTNFISAIVAQSLEDEHPLRLTQAVRNWLEKLHLSPKRQAPRLLTPDQLAAVRAAALHKARELNLSEAEAECLVEAVVGSPVP